MPYPVIGRDMMMFYEDFCQTQEAVDQIVGSVQEISAGLGQQAVSTGNSALMAEGVKSAVETVAKGSSVQAESIATAVQMLNRTVDGIGRAKGLQRMIEQFRREDPSETNQG